MIVYARNHADFLTRKHGTVMSAETVDRVQKVINRFEPPTIQRTSSVPVGSCLSGSVPLKEFLSVSALDAVTAMNTLFPARRPVSVSSDHDTLRSGIQSSASSVSGFSLFRAADPSGLVWNPTTSSTAWLPPPTEHINGSLPEFENSSKIDLEVMDARSELEEYVAGHGTNDTTHWALLAASDDVEQVDSYSRVLDQDTVSGDWHSLLTPDMGGAKLSSSSKLALETLLGGTRGSVIPNQNSGPPDCGHAAAVSEQVLKLFDDQIADCEAQSDFVASHTWLSHLRRFPPPTWPGALGSSHCKH
jgi:hypothetical protein